MEQNVVLLLMKVEEEQQPWQQLVLLGVEVEPC